MAVKIRLKRLGKIRTPHYRIVVADAKTKRDGRVIEEIGRYIPTENPSFIEVNSERARYWLSVGAQPTEQVMVLLKLTGDYQASKGDKDAKNVVQVKAPKEPFVIDTKKKAVLLPKEEVVAKKAKAEPAEAPSETEAVAPEAEAVAAPAEAPAETPAETTEAVAEVVAEEVVVEAEVPVAEAAATEEAPVAEAAEAEKTTEA